MSRENPEHALNTPRALLLLSLCAVFLMDLFTRLGFANGIIYLPVLIWAMRLRGKSSIFQEVVLLLCLVGTVLGYFLAPEAADGIPDYYVVANRILSGGILIFGYIVLKRNLAMKARFSEVEQKEESQREYLEYFIECMPIQIWSANPEGEVDFVSGRLAEFAGKTQQEILADWTALLHPEDRVRTIEAWSHSIATTDPYRIDFRLRRHDGNFVWFQTEAVAQKDTEGNVKRWLGSSIDIDDLRHLQEQSDRLAEQFRHTVESITDAFFTLDNEFRFTYLNQKAADTLGGTSDQFLGKVIWETLPVSYEGPFAREFRKAAETREALHFEEFFEPAYQWLEVHVYPSAEGLTVYFSDVTLRRQEKERLAAARKMESIGQLTGGISHDFNNLLTVILGNAELLEEELAGNGKLSSLAGLICQAAEKGAALTRNLLAFARKQPLSPQIVSVADLLREMRPILESSLGERNPLQLDVEEGLCLAFIDASQLESAILNLAINAHDALPQGGTVKILAKNYVVDESEQPQDPELSPGKYIQITFIDNGVGIPADLRKRIFEPFFSTKPDAQGSGLGLSMIYGFLKQSKGAITVYSEPGLGSSFHLYLPCVDEQTDPDAEAESMAPRLDCNEATVLVVEDNPDIRFMAENVLRRDGFRVISASSGDEALELITGGLKTDLLFSDVVMPGNLSGTELAKLAVQYIPGLRVILTSGFADLGTVCQSVSENHTFLPKPYRSGELLDLVHTTLNADLS